MGKFAQVYVKRTVGGRRVDDRLASYRQRPNQRDRSGSATPLAARKAQRRARRKAARRQRRT